MPSSTTDSCPRPLTAKTSKPGVAAADFCYLDSKQQRIAENMRVVRVHGQLNHVDTSLAPQDQHRCALVNEYTPKHAVLLAESIDRSELSYLDTNQNDICKILEAAKNTVLNLLSESKKSRIQLDVVSTAPKSLVEAADQLLHVLPPQKTWIKVAPETLPMDHLLRTARACILNLHVTQTRMQLTDAVKDEKGKISSQDHSDDKLRNVHAKPGQWKDSENHVSKIEKGNGNGQVNDDEVSASERSAMIKASTKRKRDSGPGPEEEFAGKPSRKKPKNQASPVEEATSEIEPEETQQRKTKTAKKSAPCSEKGAAEMEPEVPESRKPRKKNVVPPIEEPITAAVPRQTKERKGKCTSHFSRGVSIDAPPEKPKKKGKKATAIEADEKSDGVEAEPKIKKHKKLRPSSLPVKETTHSPSKNPAPDDEYSMLGEALGTLAEENMRLKAILQAVGISAVNVSVGLTKMKHGKSAQDIFSAVKKEADEA